MRAFEQDKSQEEENDDQDHQEDADLDQPHSGERRYPVMSVSVFGMPCVFRMGDDVEAVPAVPAAPWLLRVMQHVPPSETAREACIRLPTFRADDPVSGTWFYVLMLLKNGTYSARAVAAE
jgi:hypothetical protein